MSRAVLREAAASVISRILEDGAFMFTDQLEPCDIPRCGEWEAQGAGVAFRGDVQGELHMWTSDGFARSAAANMLGIDAAQEGAQEKGMDALKELLNMITGNLLTSAYGCDPVFDLTIPRMLDAAELDADMQHPTQIWLQADEHAVLFTVAVADDV